MSTNFHFLANSLLAVVCVVMGASFLSLHIPNKEGLRSYKISLKVLSGAYFVLSLFTIAVLVFNLSDNSREYFTFLSILISSTQALLFTFTLITLINPNFVKIGNVVRHLIPYLILTTFYLISLKVFDDPKILSFSSVSEYLDNPTIWIRILFMGYFTFQLIYYTYLFLRESRLYDDELLNYFSEVYQLKMEWVRVLFFSALIVGITALISNFLPMKYDWTITLIFSVFYFGFAQEYIKYNKVFTVIEPAITAIPNDNTSTQSKIRIKTDWSHYKKIILTNKYYCKPGVTIEDLASKLNIGRTTLSNLINREEGVNFNSWINRLRIEDAKQILLENPDYTIATISETVGYTEQANFSRQFKQITGESPLLWRKKKAS
ncbi:MAG: helix-turn-helix domain-containing protein [Tenuifilaceae bacterium]